MVTVIVAIVTAMAWRDRPEAMAKNTAMMTSRWPVTVRPFTGRYCRRRRQHVWRRHDGDVYPHGMAYAVTSHHWRVGYDIGYIGESLSVVSYAVLLGGGWQHRHGLVVNVYAYDIGVGSQSLARQMAVGSVASMKTVGVLPRHAVTVIVFIAAVIVGWRQCHDAMAKRRFINIRVERRRKREH